MATQGRGTNNEIQRFGASIRGLGVIRRQEIPGQGMILSITDLARSGLLFCPGRWSDVLSQLCNPFLGGKFLLQLALGLQLSPPLQHGILGEILSLQGLCQSDSQSKGYQPLQNIICPARVITINVSLKSRMYNESNMARGMFLEWRPIEGQA